SSQAPQFVRCAQYYSRNGLVTLGGNGTSPGLCSALYGPMSPTISLPSAPVLYSGLRHIPPQRPTLAALAALHALPRGLCLCAMSSLTASSTPHSPPCTGPARLFRCGPKCFTSSGTS